MRRLVVEATAHFQKRKVRVGGRSGCNRKREQPVATKDFWGLVAARGGRLQQQGIFDLGPGRRGCLDDDRDGKPVQAAAFRSD